MFKSIQRSDDLVLPPKKKKGEEMVPYEKVKKISGCLKNIDHRFTMHISTDKHQYKPGEVVHIRGILLNEFDHTPAFKRFGEETFNFRILGPSGDVVLGGDDVVTPGHKKSVVAIDWNVPEGQAGGTYKIQIGKQYYEEKEMEKDEKESEEKKEEESEGEEDEGDFEFASGSAATMQIEETTITRVGKQGWHGLVKIPVKNKESEKFRFRVDKSHSDSSGLFIGVIDDKIRKNDIWKSLSVNDTGKSLKQGDILEIEVRDTENLVRFKINDGPPTESRAKIPQFQRPLKIGIFMHYKGNKVTWLQKTKGGFFPMSTRTFDVNNYEPPKFKMNLEFERKGYSSGGKVKASLDVERSEGGRPDQCEIVATARVDGSECFRQTYTCTTGMQDIEFTLPEDIKAGDGNLNCSVTEGVTENISKTIPILLKKIDCKVYPEGGDLVYGVKNGCYIQANTLYGDPADFAGFLMEGDRPGGKGTKLENPRPVCEVRTVHEGRGCFEFVPKRGKSYEIKVLDPLGISVPVEVPEIKDIGLTIRLASRSSVPFGQPIDVILAASRDVETKLGLYKKEKCISISESVHLNAGEERLFKLDPKDCDGVLRVTAYFVNTGFGVTLLEFPICERLIMVKPRDKLRFDIESKKSVFSPGEKCELTIRPVTAEGGRPVNAVVCVTVTDDSVIQMQEKRKRPPRLIEMVYMENEVKELKDCTAYLQQETDNKVEHGTCCDLLLGTQGWRRFVYRVVGRNKKFYELDEYKETDKQFFFRMLNLPNPEYYERKKEMERKLEELRKQREEQMEKQILEQKQVSYRRRRGGWGGYGGRGGGGGRRGRGRGGGGGPVLRSVGYGGGGAPPAMMFDSLAESVSSSRSMIPRSPPRRAVKRSKMKKKKMKFGRAPPPAPKRAMKEMRQVKPATSSLQIRGKKKPPPASISSRSRRRRPGRPRRPGYFQQIIARPAPPPPPPAKIDLKVIEFAREFAHKTRPGKKPEERDDFTETVFFTPYHETSYSSKSKHFETNVVFDLSDSISSFVVRIDAFSVEGGYVGSSTSYQVKSQKPFFLSPKLPLELSMADEVRIPCGIINNLPLQSKCSVEWDAKGTQMKFRNPRWEGQVGASERKVEYFDMKVESAYVDAPKQVLSVRGSLDDFRMEDVVKKEVAVKPYGFLTCQPFSGTIRHGEEHEFEITFDPETFVNFSMETVGFVVPSTLGNLLTATQGMFREPYGCFEQVASTMFPMIMAKQFLMAQDKIPMNKDVEKYLRHGYKKLVNYEIRGGGFDWYGRAPSNESLSAMGLGLFVELSKVFTVNPKVIARTRKWLLSRRNGSTFRRGSGRYAYGHAKPHTTNAYICWSISRAGGSSYADVREIMQHLHQNAVTMSNRKNDNYVTSLLSMAYFNFGMAGEASQLAQILMQEQNGDGSFGNALDTMTRSGGRNKTLECTALSVLSMMNFSSAFGDAIAKGVNFIVKNNQCGSYGSTQSTVLCLQAVVKYFDKSADCDGSIELEINGATYQNVHIPKYQDKQVDFPDFSRQLKTNGEPNKIVLKSQYGSNLPFSFAVWYKVSVPPQEQASLPFTFGTALRDGKIREGDTTEIEVTLENKTDDEDGLPMIVAIVAVPSGLTVRMEKLKELQNKEVFSYFETFGPRNVVFYWRGLKPKEKVEFSFDVSASIPGKYMGDASRAYLYYDNDVKFYVRGLQCEIETKN